MFRNQYPAIIALALLFVATPSQVHAQAVSATAEDLRAQLVERDAAIIELQRSVAELRQRVAVLEKRLQADSPQPPVQPRPEDSGSKPTVAEPETTSGRSDPSRLSVDLVAAERALERTLVEAGALLLPRGAFDLTPSLSFAVSDFEVATIVDGAAEGELGILRVDQTVTSLGLTARVGLPFDSQLELGLPYQSITEESALSVLSGPISRTKETGRGSGDLRIGISKTLVRENGFVPDVVGRLTWNTGQGTESDNGIFLGGGVPSLSGSLSFVKRKDPLALFLSLDYQDSRRQDGVKPGDAFGISLGTGLAVSPASSLFGSINHRSISEIEIGGETVAGSDLDVTSLTIGFSTILSRGTLLNLYSEVGMSDDAPDYSIGFSIPMRVR